MVSFKFFSPHQFNSVQSLNRVQLFATPWIATHQASLFITNSWNLLKLMSIELMMPSNHLILCYPLLFCLQSFPVSGSFPMCQLFASGGQSVGVSVSAPVFPMNIQDWFPLGWTDWISLAVQGTLKSLLRHHNSKAQYFSTQLFLWSNSHIQT